MAEIVPVVSESLEAQVRALLPSQRGFGEDLQASNVITPIIDLTAAAEGTTVPQYQQQALAFGSQTSFSLSNSAITLINTPGFFRVIGTSTCEQTAGLVSNIFEMGDGLSVKDIWEHKVSGSASADSFVTIIFDFVVFLRANDRVILRSSSGGNRIGGSFRQIADVNGNAVNPVGFTPQ